MTSGARKRCVPTHRLRTRSDPPIPIAQRFRLEAEGRFVREDFAWRKGHEIPFQELSMKHLFWFVMIAFCASARGQAQTQAQAVSLVDVRSCGARGDGIADDTPALLAAMARAKAGRGAVWVSPGIYRHSQTLELGGVSMRGAGARSVLQGDNEAQCAVVLSGDGAQLKNVQLRVEAATRLTTPQSAAVYLRGATNFVVDGVRISGAGSAGIFVQGGGGSAKKPSQIVNCFVSGTQADGIHITNGARFVRVAGNVVTGVGDDCIAVVSYLGDGKTCSDIAVARNSAASNRWGRGLAVVGGARVSLLGNRVSDAFGAGIYLAAESGEYNTFGAEQIVVADNVLTDSCRRADFGHAGIHIYGNAAHPTRDITIRGGTITNSRNSGIYLGEGARDVRIENVTIDGAGKSGIENVGGFNVSMTGTNGALRIERTQLYGIYNGAKSGGTLRINGAQLSQINASAQNYVDAILVESNPQRASVSLAGNTLKSAAGQSIEHFIECHLLPLTPRTVENNVSDPGAAISVGP